MPDRFTTIVDAETLAQHIDDPDWHVIDCRFSLGDTEAGRASYAAGHLPGAVYAHLDDDLSGPTNNPTRGRHPLPEPIVVEEIVRDWGVDEGDQVVAYDDSGGAIAARLWWMLRALGHSSVAVLDGGISAWRKSGGALESGRPDRSRRTSGTFRASSSYLDVADVDDIRLDRDTPIIDARDFERYTGAIEPIDPVAGHIPGATSRPFKQNLQADGRFLEAPALKERFRHLAGDETITYCGSGVTACHNILAMAVAGLPEGKLFAPSWSGWIAAPENPVSTGDD